jgi:hypothetical protein
MHQVGYLVGISARCTDNKTLNFDIRGFYEHFSGKIQVSSNSDTNNGYFTRRPIHIYDHISLTSPVNAKCFRHTLYRKKYIHFVSNNFSRKSNGLWENLKKYRTAGQAIHDNIIRSTRFTCWLPKATNINSECVKHIAFPLQ